MEKEEYKASEILGIKNPEQILQHVRGWTSNLSEKEHVIKSVVQEIHQNCELSLDRIIYKLMTHCVPKGTTDKDIDEVKEEIWKEIGKMGFEQKYRLLKPILKKWQQARPEVLEVTNINEVRRRCAHLKDKDKIEYKGYKIFSNPEGIANLFLDAWGIKRGLDDMWEWIDDEHARYEKAWDYAVKHRGIKREGFRGRVIPGTSLKGLPSVV